MNSFADQFDKAILEAELSPLDWRRLPDGSTTLREMCSCAFLAPQLLRALRRERPGRVRVIHSRKGAPGYVYDSRIFIVVAGKW